MMFLRSCCVVLMLSVSVGCGSSKEINGKHHSTVGVFTLDQRNPDTCYEVIFGNVVWSILLSGSVVAPVYFVGWSIMEPVRAGPCNTWEE